MILWIEDKNPARGLQGEGCGKAFICFLGKTGAVCLLGQRERCRKMGLRGIMVWAFGSMARAVDWPWAEEIYGLRVSDGLVGTWGIHRHLLRIFPANAPARGYAPEADEGAGSFSAISGLYAYDGGSCPVCRNAAFSQSHGAEYAARSAG